MAGSVWAGERRWHGFCVRALRARRGRAGAACGWGWSGLRPGAAHVVESLERPLSRGLCSGLGVVILVALVMATDGGRASGPGAGRIDNLGMGGVRARATGPARLRRGLNHSHAQEGIIMAENTFKTKKGTEFPERFAGAEIKYTTPDAVEGVSTADLVTALQTGAPLPENVRQTLLNLASRINPEADFAAVLVATFNGQGLNLSVQKRIKDELADEKHKDAETGAVLGAAGTVAEAFRLGMPRAKGTGGTSGKVAKAEAKAEAAVNTALDMYRKLSPALRKQFRPQLLALGNVTEEQLDDVDAGR